MQALQHAVRLCPKCEMNRFLSHRWLFCRQRRYSKLFGHDDTHAPSMLIPIIVHVSPDWQQQQALHPGLHTAVPRDVTDAQSAAAAAAGAMGEILHAVYRIAMTHEVFSRKFAFFGSEQLRVQHAGSYHHSQ